MAYPYGEPLTNKTGLKEFEGRDSVDLLARVIYSEARGEEWVGKQAVCHVVTNRKHHDKADEFGGATYEGVILKSGQFDGMTTKSAREPDLDSQAWTDSLYIAKNNSTQYNPIGDCLWFRTNDLYADSIRISGGKEQINMGGGYRDIVEKHVVGNHTFYRVSGY